MNGADAPPLRVLLVDDEAFARQRLRDLLAACDDPAAAVVGEAEDADAAAAWLARQTCDLVLLDIRMPGGGGGLPFAARLKTLPAPPALVFVTAHAGHALAAFELDAIDYLTKPVRRERLQEALRRVARRRLTTSPTPAPSPSTVGSPRWMQVQDRGRLVRVPVDEVLYLKAELKYVTLRTAAASYLVDDALADLEGRHPGRFLRIHRNALVAPAAVRALERRAAAGAAKTDDEGADGWVLRLAGIDDELAVSRRQLAAVREALGGK